ncbi:MAG: transporter substrate-binding domain-containing protein [Desulfococcaceae bacterium]|jgi:polar amino acid transport system substrate-binding protein|nr:transporter substrate-binding domain-containing protein [Desulfococcaceae bacterium]
MKKTVLFALMIFFMLAPGGFSAEIKIRVSEGNTYPPFFMQDENGKWSGLSIELAEVLLKETGDTPNYQPLPFARALDYMKEGKIDIMLNLSITEERKEFMHFIGPQLDETIVLVVRKDSDFKIESLDDLKKLPKALGVERGRLGGKNFEEKRAGDKEFRKKLREVTEVDSNEKLLEAGRISAFLGYGYNTFYQIKSNPLYKNFKVHPFIINRDWVYFAFSKKSVSPEMLQKYQKAFDRAKEKGLFEAVRQRYLLQ